MKQLKIFLLALLLLLCAGCAGQEPPPPEFPLDGASLSIPVPDFLTEDQQQLYRQAYRLCMAMFSGDSS